MQPSQWNSCLHFYRQPLADKLELLMTRRQTLFEQEQHLLARQTELSQQRHQLLVRQTVHEMEWRLFWLKLRRPASMPQETEEEATPASEYLPC